MDFALTKKCSKFTGFIFCLSFLHQVVLSVVVIAVQGQYRQDSRTAAIISEQRYLSGDGKFGAAYTQEDGIDFKEETDPDGTRRGRYSYVDPEGQTRVVSYTAGKNGYVQITNRNTSNIQQ